MAINGFSPKFKKLMKSVIHYYYCVEGMAGLHPCKAQPTD